MSKKTFGDLYAYMQHVLFDKVSEDGNIGIVWPFGWENELCVSIFYELRDARTKLIVHELDMKVGGIAFYPDKEEAGIGTVTEDEHGNDMICELTRVPMSTTIEIVNGDPHTLWYEKLVDHGKAFKEILRDHMYLCDPVIPVVSRPKYTSDDVYAVMNKINTLTARFGVIKNGYYRYCGNMVSVCSETEDQIEACCNEILALIDDLRCEMDYLRLITDQNKDEIARTIECIEEKCKLELMEVQKAKSFLATYLSR